MRQAMERLALATERLAEAQAPVVYQAQAQDPVSITEVDSQFAAEMADLELRLTLAKGIPPTEEEVLAAYEAQHGEPDDPRRLSVIEAPYLVEHRRDG